MTAQIYHYHSKILYWHIRSEFLLSCHSPEAELHPNQLLLFVIECGFSIYLALKRQSTQNILVTDLKFRDANSCF